MLLRAITNFFKDPKGPAPLTTEEYLNLQYPPEPTLVKGQSYEYLKNLKGYLEGTPRSCRGETLFDAIQAAKESIASKKYPEETIFKLLLDNIESLCSLNLEMLQIDREHKNILDYQGNTILHHLIPLGDRCFRIIQKICSTQRAVTPNEEGKHPLSLAAEVSACRIFETILNIMENDVDISAGCFKGVFAGCFKQPDDQTKYKDITLEAIKQLAKDRPDPTVFHVPLLVVVNRSWRRAHKNLSIIKEISGHELEKIFREGEEGFSDEKIEKSAQIAIDTMTIENLQEQIGDYGDTKLHTAFFSNAPIAIETILRKFAQEASNPKDGIDAALAMQNKQGRTPDKIQLAGYEAIMQKVKEEMVPRILKSFESPKP